MRSRICTVSSRLNQRLLPDHSLPLLAERLRGPLFFPVTAFDDTGVALEAFRAHVSQGVAAGAGAVFVCCGTGEFSALDLDEYSLCVRTAVEVATGAVPVVAGVGYGTALARRFLERAVAEGADGALVLPPYLVEGGQQGLERHYRALADSAEIDLILYQRGGAIFEPSTVTSLATHARIIGLKDGHGDLDLVQRIVNAQRRNAAAIRTDSQFLFFNGMPTAEMTQLAYMAVGVDAYSSAVFCFAPDIATAFYRALHEGDSSVVQVLLSEFYGPLVELRNLGRGYAVSLVKAGVRLGGIEVGSVRAPLFDPPDEHVDRLRVLIERGRRALSA